MKYEEFFRTHPVFTNEELAEQIASRGEGGPRAQEAILAYYKKTGRVLAVRRGLYAVVPPGVDPTTYPIDPFLIAARLTRDAVLSYHTALEFHGRAYSLWHRFTYLASRPLRPLTFRSSVFRGVRFPGVLRRTESEDFGVVTADRVGMPARVTSLERTLVDVLDRPDLSGSWEEIWRSLKSVEFFDLDQVVEYALLLGNSTTTAKVGFFLEQHRAALSVHEKYLKELESLLPRQPHYLDRSLRKSGRLAARWNLIIPLEVLERTWEEVLMRISTADLMRQLVPTLRASMMQGQLAPEDYGARLVQECRDALSLVLPSSASERAFLDLLLGKGQIEPSLLTSDPGLQQRIQDQPGLHW